MQKLSGPLIVDSPAGKSMELSRVLPCKVGGKIFRAYNERREICRESTRGKGNEERFYNMDTVTEKLAQER